MANVEWTIPFQLVSAEGTLLINEAETIGTAGSFLYLLDEAKCWMRPTPLRGGSDPVPQGDGETLHPLFRSGYKAQLAFEFWETRDQPACGESLRLMWEHLMLHVASLLRNDGRLIWTPTGYGDDRMLDTIRLNAEGWPQDERDGALTTATLIVHTRFPYAIDATEIDTVLPDSSSVFVTNAGTTEVFPVLEVDGATSTFLFSNLTTGQALEFDASQPGGVAIGGGDYGEFIFFRNTAFLNGTGTNLQPSIDAESSDFFTLVPGANEVILTGAGGTLKSWNAWA